MASVSISCPSCSATDGVVRNDCPRQNPAYRSVSPDLRKNPLRRVFAFGGAER
ncbi:hypothetical protein FHA21_16585 [Escherichia coli]|nr:hypothetical protein [Escherichia coli]